jgi:hypothetical protein
MVRDNSILFSDGACFVPSHTRTHLLATLRFTYLCVLRYLCFEHTSAQYAVGQISVRMLTPFVFYTNTSTSRNVSHLNCRIGNVSVLSACSRASAGGPLDIPLFDAKDRLRRFF